MSPRQEVPSVSDYQVQAHTRYVVMCNYSRTANSASGENPHQTTPCVTVMSAPGATFLIPQISKWVDGEESRFPEFGWVSPGDGLNPWFIACPEQYEKKTDYKLAT